LNRLIAFGAILRFSSFPPVKLNPRNFRSCGFATALFDSFTLSLSLLSYSSDPKTIIMISDDIVASATAEDLLLTVTRHGEYWRARVEEIGDPDSGLSDSTDYASLDRAKRAAVTIALDLFGTSVPEQELEWRPTPTSN
jgi:hypothetical protein